MPCSLSQENMRLRAENDQLKRYLEERLGVVDRRLSRIEDLLPDEKSFRS